MGFCSVDRARWLSRFVVPCEPGLRRWLLSHTSLSRDDVDDVVQEAYAVLAELESVEHIREPRNYLFQVARSILFQQLRRGKIVALESVMEFDGGEIPASDLSPEEVLGQRQELELVAQVIADMPVRCRDVFTLRKVHGFSQRDIAQKLGISESTVEKHLARGLSTLMRKLKRYEARTIPEKLRLR